jgi:hypothetical protein
MVVAAQISYTVIGVKIPPPRLIVTICKLAGRGSPVFCDSPKRIEQE